MLRTAVMFDGRFFLNHYKKYAVKNNIPLCPEACAQHIFEMALSQVHEESNRKASKRSGKKTYSDVESREERYLYRIFFYDCPPYVGKQHKPITKTAIDYSKTDVAAFTTQLHDNLKKKRKVALRLGQLIADEWKLTSRATKQIIKDKKADNLCDSDFELSIRQKGIDMKIGVDITSLAIKRQVDQVILIAGDADFVPAAKLARREGVDFILHTMGNQISETLFEHIDGLRTNYSFKPSKN